MYKNSLLNLYRKVLYKMVKDSLESKSKLDHVTVVGSGLVNRLRLMHCCKFFLTMQFFVNLF